MTSQVTTSQSATTSSKTNSKAASAFAQNAMVLAFGAIVIFAVGFLPMEAAHNAAHDTRHAMAFPCH